MPFKLAGDQASIAARMANTSSISQPLLGMCLVPSPSLLRCSVPPPTATRSDSNNREVFSLPSDIDLALLSIKAHAICYDLYTPRACDPSDLDLQWLGDLWWD